MFNVLTVSEELITLSNFSLSNLHLNKYLYFFYGAYLTLMDDKPMESPEAWAYGPVFSTVYHQYKRHAANAIPERSVKKIELSGDDEKSMYLKKIYELLKGYTGGQLIGLTHRNGGAWEKTYNSKHSLIIPDTLIKEEFQRFYITK